MFCIHDHCGRRYSRNVEKITAIVSLKAIPTREERNN
jgi:hypothetical protein